METTPAQTLSIAVFLLFANATYPSEAFDRSQSQSNDAFVAIISKHPDDETVEESYETRRLYGTIPEVITNRPSLLLEGTHNRSFINCMDSNELCIIVAPEAARQDLDGVSFKLQGSTSRWNALQVFLEFMPRTPNLRLVKMSNTYLVVASSEQECSTLVMFEGTCPSGLSLGEVQVKVSDPGGTYRLRESRLTKTGRASYLCVLQVDYYSHGLQLDGTRYLNSNSLGQLPLDVTFMHGDKVLAKRTLDNLLYSPVFTLNLDVPKQ